MYKEASKMGLRFETPKGNLSVEQLWSLKQTELANAIKTVKKELNKNSDDELSFLSNSTNAVDKVNELKFNILKDVYLTNQREQEESVRAVERKAKNQKLMEIIMKKKETDLESKTVEELETMLE